MEATSHLRRMAEELKCPICLSLLKSAVSLTCNHIFCNVCIDKSMKSDSTCPVCKVPYRRREIRPALHMDSLVSIYKNMEVSSGVNILVTQSEPQTQGHEDQTNDETICGSKRTGKACRTAPNTQNQRKKKTKTLKGSSKRAKTCDSDIVRPSFPTKKRVQVPQHPPQETPTRPANVDSGKSLIIKDGAQTNASRPEDMAHLHEDGDTLFSPFFWLRNEENSEEPTQPTPFEPVNVSPPDAPCFSDIKDSYDDHHDQVTSKDGNMFDSEMFEWTQRPCSPELCASPIKLQEKESDVCDRVLENVHNKLDGKKTSAIEVVLPTLSPLAVNTVDHEAKVKGSKKRAKKSGESTQKKRVKKDADKIEICTVPSKTDQDNNKSTSESVKRKKQNQSGKKVAQAVVEKASNPGDESTVSKKKKETTDQPHIKRTKRLKNQDSRNNNNNNIPEPNKDLIYQLPSEPCLVNRKIEACTSSKQTQKTQTSKDLKASKKVTFFTNEPTPSENNAAKISQPSGEVNLTKKPNATFLHKCNTQSYTQCAFCQSTEESDISGCITHYLKGKPVTLDHDDVSRAIHAHRNCTEWAPNVFFEDGIAVNLEAELARSKRIKCSCCGLKCAALGCYEKSCRRSFHFTCAKLTPQCRWDTDNFVMLCPLHASQKLPNEACDSQQKDKRKYVSKRQSVVKQSQVNVDDTVGATSRWESYGLFTKMVLCCSALTNNEKETVEKFEKLSGVTVLKKWDSRVTHVIASADENGTCRRTLKYLMGIIEGKWILNVEWIKACLEVKKPVDEQLYEINLDIHGFTGGPKLGRSRLLNKEPKLFNGFKFYFTGDFVASYKGYLHDLIIAAGGTVLHRKPVPMNNEQQFLIYSLELPDKTKPNEQNRILSQRKSNADTLASSCGAVAVSNSWILNSIAASKVQNLD
ncbi:protein BREAST CANCER SUSCEPTIBILITY 1 homolog [Bidens hawaiensis]|uniref:protein BREAST CANCER SUSCEPTIBILITY 1 homolog n=1 Tax=Bidens hawaiensis TaxID=980011 RepID=UPI00404A2030